MHKNERQALLETGPIVTGQNYHQKEKSSSINTYDLTSPTNTKKGISTLPQQHTRVEIKYQEQKTAQVYIKFSPITNVYCIN